MSWASIIAAATRNVLGHSTAGGVFLRGAEIDAHLIEGVEVIGDYGNVVGHRTEIVIRSADAPVDGDDIVVGGTLLDDEITGGVNYVLDTKVSDNGFSQQWILLAVSPS